MRSLFIFAGLATLQATLAYSLLGAAVGLSRVASVRSCVIAGESLSICEAVSTRTMGAQ